MCEKAHIKCVFALIYKENYVYLCSRNLVLNLDFIKICRITKIIRIL
jgi:hypothetical protein